MLAGTLAQRVVFHYAGPRHCEPPPIMLEDLSGWAAIGVTGVVVDEIGSFKAAVAALGFVEHCDIRFDPLIMDEPVQHLSRAIGAVADEAFGIQVEACDRPLDHALC